MHWSSGNGWDQEVSTGEFGFITEIYSKVTESKTCTLLSPTQWKIPFSYPPPSPVNTSLSVPCCMYIHVGTMM